MRVAFLNVGSLHDSVEAVAAFFISSKLDILFLTETRVLSTSTNVLNQRIAISAFKKWYKSAGSAASHCTVALSISPSFVWRMPMLLGLRRILRGGPA